MASDASEIHDRRELELRLSELDAIEAEAEASFRLAKARSDKITVELQLSRALSTTDAEPLHQAPPASPSHSERVELSPLVSSTHQGESSNIRISWI